jgi:hypothetical protein
MTQRGHGVRQRSCPCLQGFGRVVHHVRVDADPGHHRETAVAHAANVDASAGAPDRRSRRARNVHRQVQVAGQ